MSSDWSNGEMVAALGFAAMMIGSMVHVVWLLSGIKTRLDLFVTEQAKVVVLVEDTRNQLNAHRIAVANESGQLQQRIESNERRITRLEQE